MNDFLRGRAVAQGRAADRSTSYSFTAMRMTTTTTPSSSITTKQDELRARRAIPRRTAATQSPFSSNSPRIAQSGPRMLPLSHNTLHYDEWHAH